MPLLRPMGLVETELRRRATARGLRIGSLPKGALSWVPYLLKRVLRDAMRREAPLAAGNSYSIFVDARGRLLICGLENTGEAGQLLLGHDWGDVVDPNKSRSIGPPTLVPSMQDRHIVSIAAREEHCLALSRQGEVYSWGDGAKPLSRTLSQLTPKWVGALSEDRVVGVALGSAFTLAVTDAGAVFSFGVCYRGRLGHGSMEGSEVLPRRIEVLTQMGRRFVTVAAGDAHAFALAEDGELYGWGWYCNGHGHGGDEPTPRQVAAFVGQRVKHVCANTHTSCAVTETGELFTWGVGETGRLGHGDEEELVTPKRVEGLNGIKVATAATSYTHTLVADEDGVVWAFGERMASGFGHPDTAPWQPTPIPTLRVRALKSPDVLPFRS